MSEKPWKPTRQHLLEAVHKTVPDLVAPNLKVLFAGINPGLYTAAIGHHFGRPGNRFWPTLYAAGFTPRIPAIRAAKSRAVSAAEKLWNR